MNEITFELFVKLPSGTWSDIFRLLAHTQLCHNFMSKDFSVTLWTDAPFCESREPVHECQDKNNLREERNTKSPSLDLELTTELWVLPIAVAIQIFKKGPEPDLENNRELSNDCNESKNVTNIKKTSLVFKLCHDHSDSHKISNVAEFFCYWILGERTQV